MRADGRGGHFQAVVRHPLHILFSDTFRRQGGLKADVPQKIRKKLQEITAAHVLCQHLEFFGRPGNRGFVNHRRKGRQSPAMHNIPQAAGRVLHAVGQSHSRHIDAHAAQRASQTHPRPGFHIRMIRQSPADIV